MRTAPGWPGIPPRWTSSAKTGKILNTLRVIDALLKVETDFGPLWYRYNGDRYGEHEDGESGLGEYVADLDTERLPAGSRIDFTFYWPEVDRWEQTDFGVLVG